MKKLVTTVFAAALTLGSLGIQAADMTPEERAELRERANAMKAQRAQNPGQERVEARMATDTQAGATQSSGATTKSKRSKAKRKGTRQQ